MIYIVNGYPGSGKTTFEELVRKNYNDNLVFNLSEINFVKKIATLVGWNGEKNPTNRKFLSDLKDLLTNWNDVPFKNVLTEVKIIKNDMDNIGMSENDYFIFIDCREPEEVARLCATLKAKSILIDRPIDLSTISNHADNEVMNYNYDITIHNNYSLDVLELAAKSFIKNERKTSE